MCDKPKCDCKPLKLEAGKYYRTRDGKKAYIAAITPPEIKPNAMTGFIQYDNGWFGRNWLEDGKFSDYNDLLGDDLIAEWKEPRKIVRWVNVNQNINKKLFFSEVYCSKPSAFEDQFQCIDCLRIEYTEGEEPKIFKEDL